MRRWRNPEGSGIVFEGEQTGDGRIIAAGALSWENGPWPLSYARELGYGHEGAVVVGGIESLSRQESAIVGAGVFDDETTPEGIEAAGTIDAGTPLGLSVDLDDMEIEWLAPEGEDDETIVLLAASFPAGRVWFEDSGRAGVAAAGIRQLAAGAGMVAAAGDPDVADADVMFVEASDDILMRVTRARVRGATLVGMGAFDRCRIEFVTDDAPAADGEAAAAAIMHDLTDCGCGTCADCADGLVAAGAPLRPPRSWFDDPGLTELTPLRVLDNGRVFGHIAPWGQCHTGSGRDSCVMTPRSGSGYRWFHTGSVECDDGSEIAVGRLTIGGGHADVRLSFRGTIDHYDDAGTCRCILRAGEDRFGVWVAGVTVPGTTDEQIVELRRHPPSGDWRYLDGGLELVHVHAVNSPALPPLARVASGGRITALVAAGAAAMASLDTDTPGPTAVDLDALQRVLRDGIDAAFRDRDRRASRPARDRLRKIQRDLAISRLKG